MRTEQKSEVELQVGRMYRWEMLPSYSSVGAFLPPLPDAKYLGSGTLGEVYHFFSFEQNNEKYYLISPDSNINLHINEVCRYIWPNKEPFSLLSKKDLQNHSEINIPQAEKSQLLNILTKLGENIK